jgi:WD40 repeat protein
MGPDGPRIWDPRSGRRLVALDPVAQGPSPSATWSRDGRQVLTESGIGVVVRDASSGKQLPTLETDTAVSELAFSRDGSRLAIGTIDERTYGIAIWDWPTGVEAFRLSDSARRVAFSPDGNLLAGVLQELGEPGAPVVRVWALDPELLLRIARSRVTRSLTEDECQRFLQRPCSDGG